MIEVALQSREVAAVRRVLFWILFVLTLPTVAKAQTLGGNCSWAGNGATAASAFGTAVNLICSGTTWVGASVSSSSVSPSGVNGSIQYNSSGLLAGDSNLVWSSVSKTLGINVSAPQGLLDLNGSSLPNNNWSYIYGNVGGGTGNPSAARNYGLIIGWNPSNIAGETQLLYGSGTGNNPQLNFGRWDGANKNIDMTLRGGYLGLGTNSPAYTLDMIGQQRVQTSGQTYSTQLSGNELFSKNSPLYLNASSTSPTVINGNGGNVGIGTTSPASQLSIVGTGGYGAIISQQNTSTAGYAGSNIFDNAGNLAASFSYGNSGAAAYASTTFVGSRNNTDLILMANNAEVMRVKSGGNVGIGTSNPTAPLHIAAPGTALFVSSTSGDANAMIKSYSTSNVARLILDATAANGRIWDFRATSASFGGGAFQIFDLTSNNGALTINSSDNATFSGTVTQNSDARLKTDIQQLPADVFEKLALIRGVTFNWRDKDRDPRQQVGVIAQDVQKAYPQLVSSDASGTLSVNYNGLVAPLIEAVKQLKAENAELRQEAVADRQRAALDHDLLFKMRQHVALRPEQITSYTESAWQYAPQPKGPKPAATPPHAER